MTPAIDEARREREREREARFDDSRASCDAGSLDACRELVDNHRGREWIEAELADCRTQVSERCGEVGRAIVDSAVAYAYESSIFELLAGGCTVGDAEACAALLPGVLDHHHWLSDCADLIPSKSDSVQVTQVILPLRVTGSSAGMRVRLDASSTPTLSERAHACIDEALAHTVFPDAPPGVEAQLDYALSLARYGTWLGRGRDDPFPHTHVATTLTRDDGLSSCPRQTEEPCHALGPTLAGPEDRPVSLLYAPSPTDEQVIERVTHATPRAAEILVQVCISTTGHASHIEVLERGGAPVLAAALSERMLHWRAKPAVLDGQRVFSCGRWRYTFELSWWPNVALREGRVVNCKLR